MSEHATGVARQARFRMPSWMIRDVSLAASGLLNPAVGGPPVPPRERAGPPPPESGPSGQCVLRVANAPSVEVLGLSAPAMAASKECSGCGRRDHPKRMRRVWDERPLIHAAAAVQGTAGEAPFVLSGELRRVADGAQALGALGWRDQGAQPGIAGPAWSFTSPRSRRTTSCSWRRMSAKASRRAT